MDAVWSIAGQGPCPGHARPAACGRGTRGRAQRNFSERASERASEPVAPAGNAPSGFACSLARSPRALARALGPEGKAFSDIVWWGLGLLLGWWWWWWWWRRRRRRRWRRRRRQYPYGSKESFCSTPSKCVSDSQTYICIHKPRGLEGSRGAGGRAEEGNLLPGRLLLSRRSQQNIEPAGPSVRGVGKGTSGRRSPSVRWVGQSGSVCSTPYKRAPVYGALAPWTPFRHSPVRGGSGEGGRERGGRDAAHMVECIIKARCPHLPLALRRPLRRRRRGLVALSAASPSPLFRMQGGQGELLAVFCGTNFNAHAR
jgi:hypothetical protein